MEPYNDNVNEQILNLWLEVTSLINNNRLVNNLSFNEAHVCNLLWRQSKCEPDYLTPTELCTKTGMIKSLMNRTLNTLEEKKLIIRTRSTKNRREVQVRFNEQMLDWFLNEHQQSIDIIDRLVQYWGTEKSTQILDSLQLISDAARYSLGGNS